MYCHALTPITLLSQRNRQAIELLFTKLGVQHLTTNEVVTKFIKPASLSSGVSFIQVADRSANII